MSEKQDETSFQLQSHAVHASIMRNGVREKMGDSSDKPAPRKRTKGRGEIRKSVKSAGLRTSSLDTALAHTMRLRAA